jgi:hypothetical protein
MCSIGARNASTIRKSAGGRAVFVTTAASLAGDHSLSLRFKGRGWTTALRSGRWLIPTGMASLRAPESTRCMRGTFVVGRSGIRGFSAQFTVAAHLKREHGDSCSRAKLGLAVRSRQSVQRWASWVLGRYGVGVPCVGCECRGGVPDRLSIHQRNSPHMLVSRDVAPLYCRGWLCGTMLRGMLR